VRIALIVCLIACSGSKAKPSEPPSDTQATSDPRTVVAAPADAASPTPVDAAPIDAAPIDAAIAVAPDEPAPSDLGCKQESKARKACNARGKAFHYGSGSMLVCGGANPPPDVMRARKARARATPCECLEVAEIERRARACMLAP
jgi:hypothetical protein